MSSLYDPEPPVTVGMDDDGRPARGRPRKRPGRTVVGRTYSCRRIGRYVETWGIRVTIPYKRNERRSAIL